MSVSTCVLCGGEGSIKFKPSSSFTSWDLLGAGNSLCNQCAGFFSNQTYRRKSWTWSEGTTQFCKPKEILPRLLSPPEPPFYVYITSSGKKQTYLKLFRKGPNMNKNGFWIGEEDLGLLHVHPEAVKEFELFARDAYEKLGEKKWKLLHGAPVEDWKDKELCERIELLKGDPLWQIVVRLI